MKRCTLGIAGILLSELDRTGILGLCCSCICLEFAGRMSQCNDTSGSTNWACEFAVDKSQNIDGILIEATRLALG